MGKYQNIQDDPDGFYCYIAIHFVDKIIFYLVTLMGINLKHFCLLLILLF